MTKKILRWADLTALCLISIGIVMSLVMTACDALENEQTAVEQGGNALVAQAEKKDPAESFAAEPMTSILGVRWGNFDNDKVSVSSELQLFVKNFTKIPLKVTIQLSASGMLKHEGKMDLGNFDLMPDEEMVFPIAAKDIPVQVVDGLGQLSVNAVATLEKKSGLVQWIAPVSPIYYRHTADYSMVETFGEDVFLQGKGGSLFDSTGEKSDSKKVKGRVKNSKGQFTEVTAETGKVELKDKNGESAGFVTGMSISFGEYPETKESL